MWLELCVVKVSLHLFVAWISNAHIFFYLMLFYRTEKCILLVGEFLGVCEL